MPDDVYRDPPAPPQKLTAAEKAERDAQERTLLAEFIAWEPVTVAFLEALERHLLAVAKRYRPWLLDRWDDFRANCQERMLLWRRDGKLRADEPLNWLASRLVKQEGDKEAIQLGHETDALSFDDPKLSPHELDALDTAVSVMPVRRQENPERDASTREELRWFFSGAGRLSATDRETFVHQYAVSQGEHATLGEALGVTENAARVRRHRMKASLFALAVTRGARDMAERLGSKQLGELPLAEGPRAGHRLEELIAYSDGELDAAARAEIERHAAGCEDCTSTLQTLREIDRAFELYRTLPPPPIDPALVARLEAKYPRRAPAIGRLAIGAALLALLALGAWLFRGARPLPPPQLPPPVAPAPAALPPSQPNTLPLSAPAP